MQINNLPDEFVAARPVMQTIERAGFEAYFVGGSVRDTILGLPIHDVDIASSAYPAEIKSLFHRTVDTGIEHGTVMVMDHGNGYEVTTFRTESGYQDYRRPDKVTFVRSLKEDLKRRDFTINALAMRENGEIIDLFDGIGDLKRHLIKAVGDANVRFNEDALRMMRAVRFASKLNFKIEPTTFDAINRHSALLDKIAVERIHEEFVKMMLGQDPNRGLMDMLQTQMAVHVPELGQYQAELDELSQMAPFHLANEVAVWGLLTAKFRLNRQAIGHFLKSWKTANQIIKDTQLVVAAVEEIRNDNIDALKIYQTGLDNMVIASQVANNLGFSSDEQQIQQAYERLPIHSSHELAINGRILIQMKIIKPGPKLGKILTTLEKMVVEQQVVNEKTALIKATQNLLN